LAGFIFHFLACPEIVEIKQRSSVEVVRPSPKREVLPENSEKEFGGIEGTSYPAVE